MAASSAVTRPPERLRYPILASAVVLLSLANNHVWLTLNTRPPRQDDSYYLTLALEYREALSRGVGSLLHALFRLDPTRPPLVPFLATLASFPLGPAGPLAEAVNGVAFGVLGWAVYRLAARLAGGPAGLCAVFLTATYPGIFGLSRLFYLDFVQTAVVAVCLLVLLQPGGLSRIPSALAFGFAVGLGLMCRTFFPVFVVGPLAVSFLRQGNRGALPQRWEWAALAALAVAGPWYLRNMIPVAARSLSAAFGAEAKGFGPPDPFTLRAVASYLLVFMDVQATPIGVVLGLAAAALRWPRAEVRSQLAALLAAIGVPLLFFSLLTSQDPKNSVAVLPALAVLTAGGLAGVRPGISKSLLGVLVVGAGLFQVWVGTFGTRLLPQSLNLSLGYRVPGILLYRQAVDDLDEGFLLLPRTEAWPLAEIVQRVGQMSGGQPDRAPRLAVVPDHTYFNSLNIRYFAVLTGLSTLQVIQLGRPRSAETDPRRELMTASYAVVKTGNPGPAWLNVHNRELMEFLASPASPFAEAGPRISLPDGSQAIIYARREGASRAPHRNDHPRSSIASSITPTSSCAACAARAGGSTGLPVEGISQ